MNNAELHSRFVLRTPLLPWNRIYIFLQIQDPAKQMNYLKEIYSEKTIQEALFVASKDLYGKLLEFLQSDLKDAKEEGKVARSLVKYLVRMGSRCTPFGLFAGTGIGHWNKESNFILPRQGNNQRFTAPDFESLFNIKYNVSGLISNDIKYYKNSSLYLSGAFYKYIRFDVFEQGSVWRYRKSSTPQDDHLKILLNEIDNGRIFSDLVNILSNNGFTEDRALSYVTDLVERQILIDELNPSLNDGSYFDKLAKLFSSRSLNGNPLVDQMNDELIRIEKCLQDIDARYVNPISDYDMAKFRTLQPLAVSPKDFHVDMLKISTVNFLSYDIAADVRKAAEIINRCSRTRTNDRINSFKIKFKKRFHEQEVPLLIALSADEGISYKNEEDSISENSLIDNLTPLREGDTVHQITWHPIDSMMISKLLAARQMNNYSIEITDTDVSNFPANWENVPETMAFLFSLVQPHDSHSAYSINLTGGFGASALNSFSKYCHLHKDFESLGREMVTQEDELNPDVIIAEFVHLPGSTRLGNVLQRRVSRRFEVPFLSLPSKSSSIQIKLDDLFLCVRHDKLILRSRKHQKEVRIKLSTAHNYTFSSLPLYHFLGDLQYQDLQWPIQMSWGELEREYKFLPRLHYGNIIISPAHWIFTRADYQYLFDDQSDANTTLENFRKKWTIPRFVTLSDDDNKLLIDFENTLSIEIFLDVIRKVNEIRLEEFLQPAAIIKDEDHGVYANEVVAIFKRSKEEITPIAAQPSENLPGNGNSLSRTFVIGEWLTYRFLTTPVIADHFLQECMGKTADELVAKNLVDWWFFKRTEKPECSLEVVFHINLPGAIGSVIEQVQGFLSRWNRSQQIHRVQIETYQRELERFAPCLIELCESYFFHNSCYCIKGLEIIQNSSQPDKFRWMLLFKAIDDLLEDFQFNLSEKAKLLKEISRLSRNIYLEKELSKKYRETVHDIQLILEKKSRTEVDAAGLDLLRNLESNQSRLTANKILRVLEKETSVDRSQLILNLMSEVINRLCLSEKAQQEVVLYDYLYRYYSSWEVRTKARAITP